MWYMGTAGKQDMGKTHRLLEFVMPLSNTAINMCS